MRARVKWIEGAAFMGEADSGHGLIIDGAPDIGGRNLGVRPMEMVLTGLCGCTAMDVISILRKQRQAVTDCVISAEAERADSPPKVFTRIHLTYRVTGHNLRREGVERAVALSAEKYCSVSQMLLATVAITHSIEVEEAAAG